MKKGIFFAAFLSAQVAFAADCPPAESLDFEGIHLGADKESILKIFPTLEISQEQKDITLDFDSGKVPSGFSEFRYGNIHFNKEGKVSYIYFNYNIEFLDKPAEMLKDSIINKFNLPSKEWISKPIYHKKTMKAAGYDPRSKQTTLKCKDYYIKVTQDFDIGKGAMGARLQINYPEEEK